MKKQNKKEGKNYGWELVLDLHGCDPKTMASKKQLHDYIVKICKLIEMKRYGQPLIERFGFGEDFTTGYSLVQLIETSSITGHFSDLWGSCYINIFSCKPFDAQKAREFTRGFFKAKKVRHRWLVRS